MLAPLTSPGTARVAALALLALAATASQAQGRYKVSADGNEVTDTTTQLVWKRCAEGLRWDGKACTGKLMKFKYAEAKQHLASTPAWRIPTLSELKSLVDRKAKKKPLIDAEAFPDTPKQQFWATRPGTDDDLNAWLVNFSNGKTYGNVGASKFPLRLVRSAS